MPPGFGKTKAIRDLCRLYGGEHVAISAPTAVAANIYADGVARTYHSRYWDIVYGKSRGGSSWAHSERVHVIDECFMCSKEHLVDIIASLRGKYTLILVGDSAQLPPVLAAKFVPDPLTTTIFECDFATVILPRFVVDGRCEKLTEFGNLILCLKRLIDSPDSYYPMERYSVECFTDLFRRLMQVEENTSCVDVVSDMVARSVLQCRKYNQEGVLSSAVDADSLRLACYTNELNQAMVPRICDSDTFDKEWLRCITDESGNQTQVPACLVVREDHFFDPDYSATLVGLCKYTSPTILKTVPTFFSGMCVINKHNRRDAYNGEKFWVDSVECSDTVPRTVLVDRVACHVSTYRRVDDFSGHLNVNKDPTRRLEYIKYVYCLRCGRAKERERSCAEMCRVAIEYYELVVAPAYVQTIYGLQGCTLDETAKLRLFANLVFKKDKLRTLYVLLSRVKNPKQIVVDNEFITKAIATILGKKTNNNKRLIR